jgi:hypothetical protein
MASSSATHNKISIVIDDNIDEDGNDFLFTIKTIRSHQTSKCGSGCSFGVFAPQLVAN